MVETLGTGGRQECRLSAGAIGRLHVVKRSAKRIGRAVKGWRLMLRAVTASMFSTRRYFIVAFVLGIATPIFSAEAPQESADRLRRA